MPRLMRCEYCGLLQDEPGGVKICAHCGGTLCFEEAPSSGKGLSYIQAEMELDQVAAPAGRNVDRYLMLTLRTPAELPSQEAAPTPTGRPMLNLAAVLDVSGSMSGTKIEQAKEATRQALHRLHDGDIFSLVIFSSEVKCIVEPTVINNHTRRTVESALREITAGGMTALDGGLELGLKKARKQKQETNFVLLLLSDGQANVGVTDLEKIGYRAYQGRQKGFIVSTIGVGNDYNEALMAEIATQGGGRFYHVQRADQIGPYLTGELGEVAALAARGLIINLTLPAGATIFPLSAAYPASQGKGQATITIGDIPCDTELEIPIRLTLPTHPPGSKCSIQGTFRHRSPAGNTLTGALNRVTVRFKEAAAFTRREGVVVPVVERVLGQMKAAHVLNAAREMARNAPAAEQRFKTHLTTLREYATLLGEERAQQETANLEEQLTDLRAPAVAKMTVAAAHSAQRGTKRFG